MPWTTMNSSGTSITFVSSTRREKKNTPSQRATEDGNPRCPHPGRHSNSHRHDNHHHSNHHQDDHHHSDHRQDNHHHSNQVSTWPHHHCTKHISSEISSSHDDNHQQCGHGQKNAKIKTSTTSSSTTSSSSRRTNFFHIGITAGSRAVANVRSRQVRIVSPNQHISIITPKRQIRIVSPSTDSSTSSVATSRSNKEESEVQRTVLIQPRQSVRIVKQNSQQTREESGSKRSGGVSYRFVRKAASNVTRFTKETRQSGGGSVVMRYPWGRVDITRGQTRNIVSNDGRTDDCSAVRCTNLQKIEEEETESQRTVERLEEGKGGEVVVNREGAVQRRRVVRPHQAGQRFVSVMYIQTTPCKYRGRKVKHGS
ncbi:PREDICTED: lateral signaling target protein 2 homolog isoform X1 [Branchiostoma belcheri]|uniref:Lateral signaling target protein 2 homolog isoform X1 n=1 Tax=Branchiostoma belcheri TaxID=7741 RepID=A0A6P4XAJ7_BRABE|nr:PREDICTED: lateral signaling target protein 2 homolog isoform X1 [Branchiostoma belcheri]